MKPSIGRIVHYQVTEEITYPAIIVQVSDIDQDCDVLLCIFGFGTPMIRYVAFSETPKLGHWFWPPRV